jgi:hypothetical protein
MRTSIFFICLFLSIKLTAQRTFYIAALNGLNMREKPETTAKVLDKIAYGQKVSVTIPDNAKQVSIDGYEGNWGTVNYNGKTGYIIDCYLLPVPPPKASAYLDDYFEEISTAVSPLVKYENQAESASESYEGVEKQLFKNGFEFHHFSGYEVASSSYYLPGFTVQNAFLLLSLLNHYKKFLDFNTPFPKKEETENDPDKKYNISWNGREVIIRYDEGCCDVYSLRIYGTAGQTIIETSFNY